MTTTRPLFAADDTLTISLTSLGTGSYRSSAVKSNETTRYVSAQLGGSIQVGAVTVAGTVDIYVYAGWSLSGYTGGLDGTETNIDWGASPVTTSVDGLSQLYLLTSLSVAATDDNNDIEFGPTDVGSVFGGQLPRKWGVLIHNNTDIALHATGSNNTINWAGYGYETVA